MKLKEKNQLLQAQNEELKQSMNHFEARDSNDRR